MILSTVTLDTNTLFLMGGAVCSVLAFGLGFNTQIGKILAGIGALGILWGVLSMVNIENSNNPDPPAPNPYPNPYPPNPNPYPPNPYPPTPGPNPYPTPTPAPTPMPFAQSVQQAFMANGGTKEEATILGSLFKQQAESMAFDGQQTQPLISSGFALGNSFSKLQQYRMLRNPTPFAEKFPMFEMTVSAEIKRLGLTEGQWDAKKRADAILLFSAVGDALLQIQFPNQVIQ